MANSNRWTVERTAAGVVLIHVYDWAAGDVFEKFVTSDVHVDHIDCDLPLFKRHMDEALEKNAPVSINGDYYCCMQGRNDKRRSPSALRPELQGENYFDKVHDFGKKAISPYRKIIALVKKGNHETAIEKHNEIDLIARLVESLNADGEASVNTGDYCSWMAIRFHFKNSTKSCTKMLYFDHGYGGASPVTRGVIDTARTGLWCPDADVFLMGHSHSAYIVPIARQRITTMLHEYEDVALHVRTPGYKADHKRKGGFAIEKGIAPTTRGGVWLKFSAPPGTAASGTVSVSAELAV